MVLRGAAAIGLAAGLTLAAGLFLEGPVWLFVLAMALVGTYKGFNNPAVESIFADSVQTGKRYAVPQVCCKGSKLHKLWNCPAFAMQLSVGLLSCSKLYTWKHVVTSLSSAFGPVVSIIMFLSLGNRWEVCHRCMCAPA